MCKPMQAWNRKPFCSKIPGKRFVQNYEAHPCGFCGSAIVIGGDFLLQKNGKSHNKVFCDIQCAGEYKKMHNLSNAYASKWSQTREQSEFGKAVERRNKEKWFLKENADKNRWSCCSWCFSAYRRQSTNQVVCGERCREERDVLLRKIEWALTNPLIQLACQHCGDLFAARSMRRKFCSERCERKSCKRRRKHRLRTNGYHQSFGLNDVARKSKWKCVACGLKCSLPDGTSKMTEATIDHIQPISKGGLHMLVNCQLLCRSCNNQKLDTMIEGTQMLLPLGACTPPAGRDKKREISHDLAYRANNARLAKSSRQGAH